jgi:hypothetical protein
MDKALKIGAEIGMQFLKSIEEEKLNALDATFALLNMTSAIITTLHHVTNQETSLEEWVDTYCKSLHDITLEVYSEAAESFDNKNAS